VRGSAGDTHLCPAVVEEHTNGHMLVRLIIDEKHAYVV